MKLKKCLTAVLCAASALMFAGLLPVSAETTVTEKRDKVYSIASCSKTFAAAAAMQLAEEGKLDIDASVTEYIPEFTMADKRYRDITVRMLMNHTSGLCGTVYGDDMLLDDRKDFDEKTFLDTLSTQYLKADPGEYSCYCNDGFSLLTIVVEKVSGENFTDYLEKHICQPLGLTQTGTPYNMFRSPEQQEIFISGGKRFVPEYDLSIGSGGILSTATDLCRFGSSFFSGNNVILSDKSKIEMMKSCTDDEYGDGFGLGWDMVEAEGFKEAGVKVIGKGGDLINQHAQLLVAPEEDISVAVLSNVGSSTYDFFMASALMDVALAEKGITIEHKTYEDRELLEEVPEKYKKYEGLYADAGALYRVSFPDMKCMQVTDISSIRADIKTFRYTSEDSFVLMDGEVQDDSRQVLTFTLYKGRDFICSEELEKLDGLGEGSSKTYALQRIDEVSVSDDVQRAWDERNGRKYYFCSGGWSNVLYADSTITAKIKTYPEVAGYVTFGGYSGNIIKDSNNAEPYTAIPNTRSRDISRTVIKNENGCEYLCRIDNRMEFIAEECMPDLTSDISEITLDSSRAVWYKISSGLGGTSVTFERPEKSSVYVYDRFDRMTYSSYMTDCGSTVYLPVGGKIAFIGESGSVKVTK